ncbi:HpcH/HpaI aldolase family protein [Terrarubrum flagellatum]|uniref:HpcH/HpaI aldolase family protein n=1 Tax=Terrirubrum flagellatum TaxID=2895980 RepID=UPI003144F733
MSSAARKPSPMEFRRRFLAGETLLGSFIKTPTGHATEILGGVGFDFVVIDEEHAPFDRVTIDQTLLAARAAGTAGIVRVAEPTPAKLLAVLDDGAIGVLVPHVSTPEKAREMVAACRYRGGKRGFSNSPRAGDYGGAGVWAHVDAQDATVTVIAMIEDPEALDHLDEILAVDGLDGIFVGRGDLTVALGAPGMDSPQTLAATEKIAAAARKAKKPICMMVGGAADAAKFTEIGASAFIVSSDQGLMRQAATKVAGDFMALRKTA